MGKAVIDNQFQRCVEIGIWRGRSLVPLAIATKYTNGLAYGIDPYTANDMSENDAPKGVMEILPTVITADQFRRCLSISC